MITENKKLKLVFYIFSFLCLIAVVACVVCDISIARGITWSLIPIAGIVFSWVVITPLMLAKRNKIVFSLLAFSMAILPFLYSIDYLAPVKGWFTTLGMPVGITSILAMWVTYAVIRFLKINIWCKSAIILFLYGVVMNSVLTYYISLFLGSNFLSFGNIINFLACIVITILLSIIGYGKHRNEKLKQDSEEIS